jgi:hypothetical protein
MRYLIFLLFTFHYGIIYSQDNMGNDFCHHMKFENYVDKKAKIDSGFVKPFFDSIKSYFIKNETLKFPEICQQNGKFHVDLRDVMECFTGFPLQYGIFLYDFFVVEEKFDRDSVFQKIADKMRDKLIEFEFPYKIYSEVFDMKMGIEYYVVDPWDFSEYTYTKLEDIKLVLFMLYA